jgi:hypothetical protein
MTRPRPPHEDDKELERGGALIQVRGHPGTVRSHQGDESAREPQHFNSQVRELASASPHDGQQREGPEVRGYEGVFLDNGLACTVSSPGRDEFMNKTGLSLYTTLIAPTRATSQTRGSTCSSPRAGPRVWTWSPHCCRPPNLARHDFAADRDDEVPRYLPEQTSLLDAVAIAARTCDLEYLHGQAGVPDPRRHNIIKVLKLVVIVDRVEDISDRWSTARTAMRVVSTLTMSIIASVGLPWPCRQFGEVGRAIHQRSMPWP